MSRHASRPRLAPAVLALLLLLTAAAATPQQAAAAGRVPRFGMAAHLMWFDTLTQVRADLDRMRAAGMTYVRFDVSWANSEPSRGSYRYLDKIASVVAEVRSRGMSLTMTLIETPAWANGGRGRNAPPSNVGDYGHFAGVLAKRLAGYTGMVYEIWNEPNDRHWWTTGVSVARYTAMLKSAYRNIKANDRDATVIVGGILNNDIRFLRGIYANGGGGSFNGIAIHPYSLGHSPGDTWNSWFSFRSSVPMFMREMARHHQQKPIWITEFGWSTSVVSDATRARFYAQAVAIARQWWDVRGVAAYTIHQSQYLQYGLIRRDNTATASWRSYAAALP
jgi:polysaccharide biosynthesis protein PslG